MRVRFDSRVTGGIALEALHDAANGGILLGRIDDGELIVEDFEPVLDQADSMIEESLAWFGDQGVPAVGFYRSAPELATTERDVELMRRHFGATDALLLLMKGESARVFRMGEGALEAASERVSFPIDAVAGIALRGPAAGEPVETGSQAEACSTRFDWGTEAEMPAAAPVPAAPVPAAPSEARRLLPPPQRARHDETEERVPRRTWWWVAAVAALTVAGGLLGYRSAGAPRQVLSVSTGSIQPAPAAVPAAAPVHDAHVPPAAPSVKEGVEAALNNWIHALRSGDADRIAACYAPEMERYFTIHNASSAVVRNTVNESITRYGAPAVLRISEISVIPLADNRAIATFRKHWQTGGRKVFAGEAQERLTFTKIRDAWRIASEQETKVYWTQRPR